MWQDRTGQLSGGDEINTESVNDLDTWTKLVEQLKRQDRVQQNTINET